MSKLPSKRKKKNEDQDSPAVKSTSSSSSFDHDDNRPKLRAKRQLSQPNTTENDKNVNMSKDTPQMRALKEKMMERQAKGNAAKRLKISCGEIENSSVLDDISETKNVDEKGMTPQMRIVHAKIQARKSLGTPNKRRETIITSKSCTKMTPRTSRGKRAKSLGGALSLSESSNESVINNMNNNRESVESIKKPTVKKSRSEAINEKLKLIRTVEAPPGVASKRIIVEKEVSQTKSECNRINLSSDLALSSSSSSSLPSRKISSVSSTAKSSLKIPCTTPSRPITSKNASDQSCEQSSTNVYKNAAARLRSLRNTLSKKSQADGEKRRLLLMEEPDSTFESFINTSNAIHEEMEWEPIEEEKICSEIQTVRAQLSIRDIDDIRMNEVTANTLSLNEHDSKANNTSALYIVIDTNVFLTNLEIVKEARDAIFKRYGRPRIVIPWTTIRELDFIKDDKKNMRPESLKAKARQAIRFIYQNFSAKHPRILGQTFSDVAMNKQKFSFECPDDEILQTCLQVRSSKNTVVLLSYDRNLCNKAMTYDIVTLGRYDSFEKIDLITEFDCKSESSFAINLSDISDDSHELSSSLTKEFAIAEELYEEAKTILTSFLTITVSKEMKNLFGDTWERHVIIKPPWTAITVLKCAIKHWIAALSDSFYRRGESILKELLETITQLEYNRRLSNVEQVIQLLFGLIQCLKIDKYPNLFTECTAAMNALQKKYQEALKEIQEYELKNKIGSQLNEEEQESKATVAFRCFKHIYEVARDFCGFLAESMGMQCSFVHDKSNCQMEIEDVKYRRPEVAANINLLLLSLSTALEDVKHLNVNHRHVSALYNALNSLYNSLLPDNREDLEDILSPLDVYFCLKRKEQSLKIGVRQFQELSSNFCRMASFQST